MKKHWLPEICYFDSDDQSDIGNKLPFIPVPHDEVMPKTLFIFEHRETTEFEPGQDGEEIPIIDMNLRQYANMDTLKENLDQDTYNLVREALGLAKLK